MDKKFKAHILILVILVAVLSFTVGLHSLSSTGEPQALTMIYYSRMNCTQLGQELDVAMSTAISLKSTVSYYGLPIWAFWESHAYNIQSLMFMRGCK